MGGTNTSDEPRNLPAKQTDRNLEQGSGKESPGGQDLHTVRIRYSMAGTCTGLDSARAPGRGGDSSPGATHK